jgi:hypothetical protein
MGAGYRVWNEIEGLLNEVEEWIAEHPSWRRSANRQGSMESGMIYQSTNPD